jgi:hypothetical protein
VTFTAPEPTISRRELSVTRASTVYSRSVPASAGVSNENVARPSAPVFSVCCVISVPESRYLCGRASAYDP